MRMKLICAMLIVLTLSSNIDSQNLYQESNVELDKLLNGDESYLCQASASIKMLPGFKYRPESDKEMLLEIDRYAVFPPEEGRCGGIAADDSGVVGALPGSFNVSTSGAAVYNIDVKLPNAIGMMMPKLSFVYNNQSGNGIMGWAWNISGLSSIERVPQTKYHDGKITYIDFVNDRFVMDGQRLMLVSGEYGGDNAEYKTEIDNFDKIVSYSNSQSPECFKVWKSDGTIWEYGSTKDSRIETQNNNKVILKWLLSKVSDRNGNAIIFNYDKNVVEGESYINNIEYTCNEKCGIKPAYKILFVYEKKKFDMSVSYVYGNKVSCKRILKNVQIINNYTGKKLYDYSLEYNEPGRYGKTYFAHYRLKSLGLAVGEDKINPTRIIWNTEEKHYPSHGEDFQIYQLDKNVFNKVPFVGDFDGDGFSDVLMVPYKIQDTYPDDVKGEVYLNNGDGTFQQTPKTTVCLSKELEWIYVVDLNDDGVDDIITYDINRNAQYSDDVVAVTNFYIAEKGEFVKKVSYSYKNNVVLLLGRFLNDRNGVIVLDAYDGGNNNKTASYIYYINDVFSKISLNGSSAINGIDADFLAMDVTGDGISEIMALKNDGYEVYKIFINKNYGLELFTRGTSITKDIYPFANDFNGDGKVDILYYDPNRFWNIVYSKGNGFTSPMSCSNTSLLRTITLNAKDRYRYSLREYEKPNVTIRTADFDGDGVADVGVFKNMAGNHFLEVGLLPFVKSDNTIDFTCNERYYMPINYSHQTIQIGRFLPQENVSILSGLPRNPLSSQQAYITSLYSHSAYYSVERIVDGMGNARGFSYDYLMKRKKQEDGFYSCDNVVANDIRKSSVPVAALKSDTVFDVNEKAIVTKYEYRNALIHTKGHGFMGFERVVTKIYINGNVVKKQMQNFDYKSMGAFACCLPSSMGLYYGENQLVEEEFYVYDNYVCKLNDKVILPLIKNIYNVNYNLDKEQEVQKVTITDNIYRSDNNSNNSYDKLVWLERKSVGCTNDIMAVKPDDCQYIKEEYVVYKDDLSNWIINRPAKIYEITHAGNDDVIGSAKVFVYDDKFPKNIIREIQLPNINEDYSDPLMVNVEYDYDKVGNMVSMTKSSPSFSHKKTIRNEYDDSYRYRIKTIDELGRETNCIYDDDYGLLISTIDYNGFVTLSENDHAGVTDMIVLPDGLQNASALRWASGNKYAPSGALFYSWEKGTGNAEKMVFYHKSGAELRNVTFDMNGNAIFVDKYYDDFGNVERQSLPYRESEEKQYVTHEYDKYNRNVQTKHPNNVLTTTSYNGNTIVTGIIGRDGARRLRINTYNYMNWLVETEEMAGNVVKYEYYSDGLMKSAQVGDNSKTKITVTYDGRRNRKSLYDPNYGSVSYEYDAFGNIVKIMNPKDGVMELEYDVAGRMVSKKVKDGASKNEVITHWMYGVEKGENGVLNKIVTSENHSISYTYDKYLRMIESVEIINGEEYRTSYKYDKASRVSSTTYPSGLTISTLYSNSGYEKEIKDADDNKVLWKTDEINANGLVTECTFGNGVETRYMYDPQTFFLKNIITKSQNEVIQDLGYHYDDFGNMVSRKKSTGTNVVEEFEYDDLDRLLGIRLNGVETAKMQYDNLGNIVGKEVNGVRLIYSTVYDTQRPNAIVKAKTDADDVFLGLSQKTNYSSFDDLLSITRGDDFAHINYGYDNNRIYMKMQVGGELKTKTYAGNCEIVEEGGKRCIYTYIDGPCGVFAVCALDEDGCKSYNYVHKDNIGSWNVITDERSEIVQEVSFDAWGNIRDFDDWTACCDKQSLLYDRGYTGHEHLLGFGLINMNGRVYDPLMSMMLSPDNNIQMPQMSQNFNRYSYCMNNPLRYNDPSGEVIQSVVMGVVGGAANVLLNAQNIDSFAEFGLLFGVGFVKGFLTEYTLGQSWLLQVGVYTAMGGITSGVNKMVSLGDGSFKFSGDDWNSIKTSAHYGMGNALVWGFMNACFDTPDFLNEECYDPPYYDDGYGNAYFQCLMKGYENKEIGHAVTSFIAHGFGCWFSGQPFLKTLKFKDFGLDLKMLACVAERILASYVTNSKFADNIINQRGLEFKNTSLEEIRAELPEFPDYNYTYLLRAAEVERGFVYIIGDIYEIVPGEILPYYYKPHFEEKVIFPFSYSLLRSIFLSNK